MGFFSNLGKKLKNACTDFKKVVTGKLSIKKAISYGVAAIPSVVDSVSNIIKNPLGAITQEVADLASNIGVSKSPSSETVEKDLKVVNTVNKTVTTVAKKNGVSIGKLIPLIIPFLL